MLPYFTWIIRIGGNYSSSTNAQAFLPSFERLVAVPYQRTLLGGSNLASRAAYSSTVFFSVILYPSVFEGARSASSLVEAICVGGREKELIFRGKQPVV
jgi:hypothetical protein